VAVRETILAHEVVPRSRGELIFLDDSDNPTGLSPNDDRVSAGEDERR
jgi:hypothetical protein